MLLQLLWWLSERDLNIWRWIIDSSSRTSPLFSWIIISKTQKNRELPGTYIWHSKILIDSSLYVEDKSFSIIIPYYAIIFSKCCIRAWDKTFFNIVLKKSWKQGIEFTPMWVNSILCWHESIEFTPMWVNSILCNCESIEFTHMG